MINQNYYALAEKLQAQLKEDKIRYTTLDTTNRDSIFFTIKASLYTYNKLLKELNLHDYTLNPYNSSDLNIEVEITNDYIKFNTNKFYSRKNLTYFDVFEILNNFNAESHYAKIIITIDGLILNSECLIKTYGYYIENELNYDMDEIAYQRSQVAKQLIIDYYQILALIT